jgi:hypothetical protein
MTQREGVSRFVFTAMDMDMGREGPICLLTSLGARTTHSYFASPAGATRHSEDNTGELFSVFPRLSGICRLVMGKCWKVMISKVLKDISSTGVIL